MSVTLSLQTFQSNHITISLEEYYYGCKKELFVSTHQTYVPIEIKSPMKEHQIYNYIHKKDNKEIFITFCFTINDHPIYKKENDNIIFDYEVQHKDLSNRKITLTVFDKQIIILLKDLKSYQYIAQKKGLKSASFNRDFGDVIINLQMSNDIRSRYYSILQMEDKPNQWLLNRNNNASIDIVSDDIEKRMQRFDFLKQKEDVLMKKQQFLENYFDVNSLSSMEN